jgi:hypothetical protein
LQELQEFQRTMTPAEPLNSPNGRFISQKKGCNWKPLQCQCRGHGLTESAGVSGRPIIISSVRMATSFSLYSPVALTPA